MKPRLYNRNMELVTVLQNASGISYTRHHNNLFTASFELPNSDKKISLCDTHFIVDIFDGDASKGKYRILDEPDSDISGEGKFIKFSCEHVIAFLLNDVIDGYMEAGGAAETTAQVIQRLLNLQTVKRWQLGVCEFDYKFQYSWENTNILDALFSVPTCFADGYHWTYDTDSYPWKINLLRRDTERGCEIRRKRNMQQIKREKDASSLCTRLYCKGSGEGVNQLSIQKVNPNGKPYIDADAATIAKYGILCSHYIDTTITDAETLFAKGKAMLELVKHPKYTYKAKAVDLAKITGRSWDDFDEGKIVRIVDDEIGVDVDAMIVEVNKKDVDGDPLALEITISNKENDTANALEDLAHRTAITAQYSQGATNLYSQQFADNADQTHPAVMRVYIPHECVQINKMLLSWKFDSFRAYSVGAASGGGTTKTSTSGGGGSTTSEANNVETITKSMVIRVLTSIGKATGVSSSSIKDLTGDAITSGSSHKHNMQHSHSAASAVEVPPLSIQIPAHRHRFSVSSHAHDVTFEPHKHDIEYGIFTGSKASGATIKVDGTAVPNASKPDEIDIVPYLSKDGNGKIKRGEWHEIEIIPDSMSRIEANLFVQTFVTSYSGGNY